MDEEPMHAARLKSVEFEDAFSRGGGGGGVMPETRSRDRAGDAALLQRIGAGDESALEAFHKTYADVLYGVAVRLMHSEHDAREILVEAFLKIWDRASSYDPRLSSPLTWAVMQLRSLCFDRMRRIHRYADRIDRARAANECLALHGMDGHARYRELREQVENALARLPENERECVILAVFSEMTHEEVAGALSQPAGTIKSRLRRGMDKLRTLLRDALQR
ncbi:MAG TPA: sigma-70 family RNA polymerase sigma factor [Verrucomicrobiales bacterium]|nr:sigma-70 family RNA polymerase sigma factor [Verrucomicrobiales bacterium]